MSAAPDMDLFTYAEQLETVGIRAQSLHPLPLAAPKEPLPWLPTKAQRAAARQRDYERLTPVAFALALNVGAKGFTADDLRAAAIERGVLTGEEGRATGQQRALSWFGPFLSALASRGTIVPLRHADGSKVRRASERPEANGNLQVVYVLPVFARVI